MRVTTSIIVAAAFSMAATIPSLASAQQTIPVLGSARQIHIQTSHDPKTFTGSAFSRVAKIDGIQVPTGKTGVFVVTFNAESTCGPAECRLRFLCDGVTLPEGDSFVFNFSFTSYLDPRSFSVTRHSKLVGAGTHSCEVRTAQQDSFHVLDDWFFAVEFWRQG